LNLNNPKISKPPKYNSALSSNANKNFSPSKSHKTKNSFPKPSTASAKKTNSLKPSSTPDKPP
jgi:hypothetical protein